MNLYNLKTPLTKMKREEALDFIRALRYNRTIDTSPPKKEKKERKKKEDPLQALFNDPEQLEIFKQFLEKEGSLC